MDETAKSVPTAPDRRGGVAFRSRRVLAGIITVMLAASGTLTATTAATAASGSGGASAPGSGGTVGNYRHFGWMFDRPSASADGTVMQGQGADSVEWFFKNNPFGPPDRVALPNAADSMRSACAGEPGLGLRLTT